MFKNTNIPIIDPNVEINRSAALVFDDINRRAALVFDDMWNYYTTKITELREMRPDDADMLGFHIAWDISGSFGMTYRKINFDESEKDDLKTEFIGFARNWHGVNPPKFLYVEVCITYDKYLIHNERIGCLRSLVPYDHPSLPTCKYFFEDYNVDPVFKINELLDKKLKFKRLCEGICESIDITKVISNYDCVDAMFSGDRSSFRGRHVSSLSLKTYTELKFSLTDFLNFEFQYLHTPQNFCGRYFDTKTSNCTLTYDNSEMEYTINYDTPVDEAVEMINRIVTYINTTLASEKEFLRNHLDAVYIVISLKGNQRVIHTSKSTLSDSKLTYTDLFTGLEHNIMLASVRDIVKDDLAPKSTTLLIKTHSDILKEKPLQTIALNRDNIGPLGIPG
jgi:hypothetical protein